MSIIDKILNRKVHQNVNAYQNTPNKPTNHQYVIVNNKCFGMCPKRNFVKQVFVFTSNQNFYPTEYALRALVKYALVLRNNIANAVNNKNAQINKKMRKSPTYFAKI